MKIGNTSFLIPNVQYTLDYTKTTQATAQTIVDITTPSYPIRLNLFAYSVGSQATANWSLAIFIDTVPLTYPNGTSLYNNPPQGFTLCGNVPTDYLDLSANTHIQIKGYMSGTATANSTLNLTMSGKQIIEVD